MTSFFKVGGFRCPSCSEELTEDTGDSSHTDVEFQLFTVTKVNKDIDSAKRCCSCLNQITFIYLYVFMRGVIEKVFVVNL